MVSGKSVCVIGTLSMMATFSSTVLSQPVNCNMLPGQVHTGRQGKTNILSAKSGVPSLFYRANMDVNTDGAARSYHPKDPLGKTLAYNNMGNAITTAWNKNGKKITCDLGDARNRRGACFNEFIVAFQGARDNNNDPNKYPKIKTKYIIPWQMNKTFGWETPCTIEDGPNKGFFVSQTAQWLTIGPKCSQSTYVDSLTINAVVYPQKTKWYSQGVYTDKGDLVVVRDRKTGIIAFAIHGDSGPSDKIGEGSIALSKMLGKSSIPNDVTYSEVKKLQRPSVDYLVFPKHNVVRHFWRRGGTTQARIDQFGKKVFKKWGGLARLDACASGYR